MKKPMCTLTAAATLLASTAAFADDASSSGDPSTQHHQQQTQQAGQTSTTTTTATQGAQPSSSTSSTAAPGSSMPRAGMQTPTSTTTLTAGTPAVTETATSIPITSRPPERDTVTVYHTVRPNKPLLYTGGILFLGSYATTAALTAANVPDTRNADKTLYLPVVGPWMHLADIEEDTTDTMLIAGSGVLQGAGVAMMLASLFVPEKVPAATIQAGNVKMNIAPTSYGKASAGVGAVGTF